MALVESDFLLILQIFIDLINFFGIIGNVISFIVFSRKAFAHNPFRIYFRSLAIFDSFVVVNLIIGIISLVVRVNLINKNNYVCKFVYFVVVGVSPNCGWILAFFSIDELVRVSMTKRFTFVKKKRFQIGLIVCMFVFFFLHATYVLFQVQVKPIILDNRTTIEICDYPTNSRLPIVYFTGSGLIPFVIMSITTVCILRILLRSQNSLMRYDHDGKAAAVALTSQSTTAAKTPATTVVVARRSSRVRDLKFAFNSVIFNVLYIVLTFPLIVIHLARSHSEIGETRFFFLSRLVCFLLFFLNFNLHFWVHFCVNSIFRKEVFRLFGASRNVDLV